MQNFEHITFQNIHINNIGMSLNRLSTKLLLCDIEEMYYGAIQKVCHRPRGRGGSSKIVTKRDKGEGVK